MSAPPYDTYQPFCNDDAVSIAKTQNTQKKPRHRHTPYQLAALNDLFEQNEHPPLEQRTALADRLGMETKTVNAWFQNKRASSKKRVKGGTSTSDSHHTNNKSRSAPTVVQRKQSLHRPEPKNLPNDSGESQPALSESALPSKLSAYKHSSSRDHPTPRKRTDSENLGHDSRCRPSEDQIEELRKLFNINSHPTPEERQVVSASLGMTYEKVTNWFQNQRYLAKKKNEDEDHASWHSATQAEFTHETHRFSAFPPHSYPHPSLDLPPPTNHPSLGPYSSVRRSPSPSMEDRSPRRSLSRVGATPYRSALPAFARTRRSRPEPYQLEALKKLFRKTPTPTIEERSALALEIGMDVGKVTNWFRNLRQTARRRAKKTGSGEDDDDDGFQVRDPYSASSSVSRSGTPSPGSPEMSIKDEDSMDLVDFDDHRYALSVDNSEDEYQEAVTPPLDLSPSPPPQAVSSRRTSADSRLEILLTRHVPYAMEIDKASVERFPGIKMEDALLLLSFHHHIVQY